MILELIYDIRNQDSSIFWEKVVTRRGTREVFTGSVQFHDLSFHYTSVFFVKIIDL